MEIKVLYLFNSVDGGTGTYLETLLQLKKMSNGKIIKDRILVLNKPKYRNVKSHNYIYFSCDPNSRQQNINITSLSFLVKEMFWFKDSVNKYKPDIVVSSNPHSILISELSKLFFKLEYKTINLIQNNLIEVINYKVPQYLRLMIRWLLGIIFIKTDCLVTDSEELSKGIAKEFQLRVKPKTMSGVPSIYLLNKKRTVYKKSKLIVTSLGRLDAQKDLETMFNAFKLANNKINNSELWVAGDGPMKNELKDLSIKLGISKNTKFVGWVQNPIEILDKTDVFIFASRWEGFGLSLLEAMSRGLPVIASNCKYGPAEILDNGKYGILVPVGDTSKMSDSIVELLSDAKKRKHFSKMALTRSKYYSKERMLKEYDDIILNVLSTKE